MSEVLDLTLGQLSGWFKTCFHREWWKNMSQACAQQYTHNMSNISQAVTQTLDFETARARVSIQYSAGLTPRDVIT